MKTYSAKPTDVKRVWHVIDATEAPLGRISTVAARLLIGKDKPMVTSHIDCGDYVIIVNADKLVVTGDKMNKKLYYKHSNFPGGLTTTTLKDKMEQDSRKVIIASVRGMLPVNKLRPGRLLRLKVYAGPEHEHHAQVPVAFSVKKTGEK